MNKRGKTTTIDHPEYGSTVSRATVTNLRTSIQLRTTSRVSKRMTHRCQRGSGKNTNKHENDGAVMINSEENDEHPSVFVKRNKRVSQVIDEITSRSFVDWSAILSGDTESVQEPSSSDLCGGGGGGDINTNQGLDDDCSAAESLTEPSWFSNMDLSDDNDSEIRLSFVPRSSSVEKIIKRISNNITMRVSIMEGDLMPTQITNVSDDSDNDNESMDSASISSRRISYPSEEKTPHDDMETGELDLVPTTLKRKESVDTRHFRWGSGKSLPLPSEPRQQHLEEYDPWQQHGQGDRITNSATANVDRLVQQPPNTVLVDLPFELQSLDQQHRASVKFVNISTEDFNDLIATTNSSEEEDDDTVRAIKPIQVSSSVEAEYTEENSNRRQELRRNGGKRVLKEQYDGDYNSGGQRHGHGTLKWSNGDFFRGTFKDGMRDGVGILNYFDGSSYEGGWQNDVFHGFGVRRFPDGYIYYGSYVNGNCHGHGQCDFPDGDRYFGNWKNGLMNGQGKYHHKNGELYEGMFVEGKREGPGRIHLRNGKMDTVQFLNGVVVGLGIRWNRSRLKAYKLENGVVVGKKIRKDEAREIEMMILGDGLNQPLPGSTHYPHW